MNRLRKLAKPGATLLLLAVALVFSIIPFLKMLLTFSLSQKAAAGVIFPQLLSCLSSLVLAGA